MFINYNFSSQAVICPLSLVSIVSIISYTCVKNSFIRFLGSRSLNGFQNVVSIPYRSCFRTTFLIYCDRRLRLRDRHVIAL